MSLLYPRSRQTEIVIQEFDDEVVIYDLKNDKALALNKTCTFVWQRCNGNQEISQISQALAKHNNQSANEDIVWLAIKILTKADLLENAEDLKSNFDGLNRRTMVKKIGLATMIALPMISTLIAPTAINAASGAPCIAINQGCTFSNFTQSDCCSNLRCDQASPTTGICMNCFMTGTSIGLGGSVATCNARPERNLCCDTITDTTTSGGTCFCP